MVVDDSSGPERTEPGTAEPARGGCLNFGWGCLSVVAGLLLIPAGLFL